MTESLCCATIIFSYKIKQLLHQYHKILTGCNIFDIDAISDKYKFWSLPLHSCKELSISEVGNYTKSSRSRATVCHEMLHLHVFRASTQFKEKTCDHLKTSIN